MQFFCVLCVCTYCPQVAKYPAHPYLSNGTTCPVRQPPNVVPLSLSEEEPFPESAAAAAAEAWQARAVVLAAAALLVVLVAAASWFVKRYWWDLVVLKRELARQGVHGPPFRFLLGNLGEMTAMARQAQQTAVPVDGSGSSSRVVISHDIVPRVLPYYREWSQAYGQPFLMFLGPQPALATSDPAVVAEVVAAGKSGGRRRRPELPESPESGGGWLERACVAVALGGEAGLVLAEGEPWQAWRSDDGDGIVGDALESERVRAIVAGTVRTVKAELFRKWDKAVKEAGGADGQEAEVEVCKRLSKVAATALSEAAFSSSHAAQGAKVFKKQKEVMDIQNRLSQSQPRQLLHLLLPPRSGDQRKLRRLQRRVDDILRRIVAERVDIVRRSGRWAYGASCGTDLLGHILANTKRDRDGAGAGAGHDDQDSSPDRVVAQCRDFFLAAYETFAVMLSWTLMLLGHHTEWQDAARAEILRLCGDDAPDAAALAQMKVLGTVLKESVRLYPPAAVLSMELPRGGGGGGARLHGVDVPAGVAAFVPVLQLHREPAVWGDDALEFKPARFADGLPRGLHPLGYLPFSAGKVVSVGQAYAVLQAKVVLAMLLQRYVFRLSPNYRHSPVTLALRPEHGVPLILSKRLPDYPDP